MAFIKSARGAKSKGYQTDPGEGEPEGNVIRVRTVSAVILETKHSSLQSISLASPPPP